MVKRIALKIDVDTCHGALEGVPALTRLLADHGARGSFFFCLGPDHSGRESGKSSLKRYYDLKTRLSGTLLPAPEIGARCLEILRKTRQAGFETGVRAWNRVAWEKKIDGAPNSWVETEMQKALSRFAEVFSVPPRAYAAAGWKTNRHALRLTQGLGFSYASDSRGKTPFLPVVDGEIVLCPQIPTTLPTLDEALFTGDASPITAFDQILQLSETLEGDHVFTLRAEIEGMRFIGAFERLLASWAKRGHSLVALEDLRASISFDTLPRNRVVFDEVPGRSGKRMLQGGVFPTSFRQKVKPTFLPG
ncbi:MAG: 4-deoxy-4-formamido-L-arabinose-phosphoundecaprenol deformylase [Candidatus Accumulibacter sp.]|nr:4-deoxy-4-formamido-L-arabinose-phosphoundecaprenol deformylase [Accumulibacter sp.]